MSCCWRWRRLIHGLAENVILIIVSTALKYPSGKYWWSLKLWIDVLDLCDMIVERACRKEQENCWVLACADLPQNYQVWNKFTFMIKLFILFMIQICVLFMCSIHCKQGEGAFTNTWIVMDRAIKRQLASKYTMEGTSTRSKFADYRISKCIQGTKNLSSYK